MMKQGFKKYLCIILAAVMIFSLTACGKTTPEKENTPTQKPVPVEQPSYTQAAKGVKKSETVYVNLSPDGKAVSTTVTDWLHTDTAETYIDDLSDLKNIVNVKSDVQPVKNSDGTIRWNMQTTDLYYRGDTDRKLPVNFKISYYLDGKEMSPDEIAGKGGQVKIVITMNNESCKEVTVGGKKTKIYTPFICAGGMIFDENSFSAVNVENGKTIGDGTKEITLLVGTPGLKESLNLSDELLKQLGDFDFTSTYTITAETEKFELSNMIFAVIPLSAVISEINNTLPGTVSDLKVQLGKIQAVIDKLNGMNVTELLGNLFSNPEKLTNLTASLGKAVQVYNDNKALLDALEKYMTDENVAAIKKLVDDTDNLDLDKAIELLSNPILRKFFKELPTLSEDMKKVSPMLNGLSEDLADPEVQKAVEKLPETLNTLKELKQALDSNEELLEALGETLNDKTVSELQSVMESLGGLTDAETLAKYNSLIKNADGLIERAQVWVKAGQEYNLFTTASKGTQTSVMFVYETSPITAKAEKKKETTTQDAGLQENGIKTFFKNLFKKDN